MKSLDGLSINLATVRRAVELRRSRRRLPAPRHHHHLPLARPDRRHRPEGSRPHRPRQRRQAYRRLPRRLLPRPRRRGPRQAHSMTTAAPSTRPPSSAPTAWSWSCGGLPAGSKDLPAARADGDRRPRALMPHARAAGVPIAIEPLHPMYAADRACVNSLEQALDICEAIGGGGIGAAIDVYHVWWEPDLANQIARAGRMGAIFAHHICDWLVPTKDLLQRPRHDGRRRDRPARLPPDDRGRRLPRRPRGRDLLRPLVEPARRRSARHLCRTLPQRLLSLDCTRCP